MRATAREFLQTVEDAARGWLWALLLGILLCGCGGGATEPLPVAPFRVQSTSPREGDALKDRRPLIYVVFSRPLRSDTVSSDTIYLVSKEGERIRGEVSVGAFTPSMISVSPAADLRSGIGYELRIDAGVLRDESGAALASDFVLSFGIEGTPPPPTPSPGGGGGGVEVPTDDRGVIYAGTCETLSGCPGIAQAFDPEGGSSPSAFDGWSGPMGSSPSPRLHDGARVFLRIQNGSGTMPDGTTARVLSAVIPNRGVEVPILGHASTAFMSGPKWARDETFISFFQREWAKSATTTLYKLPVTWDSDGVPSFGARTAVVQFSGPIPTGWGHDWAPNGEDLIYGVGTTEVRVRIGGQTTLLAQGTNLLRLFWLSGGTRVLYGDFSTSTRTLHVVDTDGANPQVVMLPGTGHSAISVSPDGKEVAYGSDRPSGSKGLFVIDIATQQSRELTQPHETIERPFGWVSLKDVR